jgi:hypothetical protein
MPRSYGVTNVAPWATAPPVGPAGDTYYNTGNKALYISDGTQWNQIQAGGSAGGAPYAPVQATPPPANNPTISPPVGLLWVDTSTTASGASLIYYQTLTAPLASAPVTVTHNLGTIYIQVQLWDVVTGLLSGAQVKIIDANNVQISVTQNMPNNVNVVILGQTSPGMPVNPPDYATKLYVDTSTDKGLISAATDLNNLGGVGNYQVAGGNPNSPPIPPGAFLVEVQSIYGGATQQRATLISSPNYTATREYSGGSWQPWKSLPAGLLWTGTGPGTAFSGAAVASVWSPAPGVGVVAGRKYRVTLFLIATNNTGAAQTFIYFVPTPSTGEIAPRIFWQGASTNSGQTNQISTSWIYTASTTATPTWTLGFNAPGTPWAIGANGLVMWFEDVGY